MSPRSPQQNEAIRAERLQQILDAALVVFAEKGYAETRIQDIARQLDVAKGTIYLYFESKELLFEAVFEKTFEAMTAPLLEVAADPSLTPADKLLGIAQGTLDLIAQESDTLFIMMQAMSTPQVANILAHDFKVYYDEFTRELTPLFEATGESNPAAAASLYMAALDGAMLQRLVGTDVFDEEQFLNQIKLRFGL